VVKKIIDVGQCTDISALEKLRDETKVLAEKEFAQLQKSHIEVSHLKELYKASKLSISRIERRINSIKENAEKYEVFAEYPKIPDETKERVWSKAYERGHSSGMYEVKNCFRDLMEIFE
jgi:hypothetical protein